MAHQQQRPNNIFINTQKVSDDVVSTPIDADNNQLNLDDIQLLNEYEKKINNDIIELEKKMQDFIKK